MGKQSRAALGEIAGVLMRAHHVLLCLQDTTELDINVQCIAGLGPLSYVSQRGMYFSHLRGYAGAWTSGRGRANRKIMLDNSNIAYIL